FSWRNAFFIASLPGLLLAFLCARTLREPAMPPRAQAGDAPAPGVRQLLANRNMVQSTVIACAMVSWLILQLIFLPIYLTKVRGMAAQDMGMLLSLAAISSVIAAVFVSKLSDVIGRRTTLIVFSLLGMVGPLGVVYLDASVGTLVVPLFIGYLACGCLPQAAATVPSESVPPHMLATAVAFAVGTAEIVGGFVAPLLAGAAGDGISASAPLLIAAGAAFLSACTAFFLHESAPRKLARMQRKQSLAA
ncbi:MAG: MFS transporter, partial [Proteobacteria bacterium]|nr:MFS transporter [Pseudomonadota bacterium]